MANQKRSLQKIVQIPILTLHSEALSFSEASVIPLAFGLSLASACRSKSSRFGDFNFKESICLPTRPLT